MTQNPNFFLSVGKDVKDEYGRKIGTVASFAITPSGKFDAVFIEQGDGKFLKRSVENLRVEGTDVTLTSTIKSHISSLCDQIPLIWRKDQALKELVDKKKISQELYQELHHNFEGVINQLKSEAQKLLDELDREIEGCINDIKDLNYALVHLELEHEIGKIDNNSYETAFAIIQENLKRVNTEKSDLEQIQNKLSNILLGDTPHSFEQTETEAKTEEPPAESSSSETPELPEPPVVVYVKEIGKSGI